MAKYLDATGLQQVWNGAKSTFLKLSGGNMTGAISWSNTNGATSGGWNITSAGIQILNTPGVEETGAPYTYATALHVGSTYWFQLCFERGGNNLKYRGGNSTTTWGWYKLWHEGNDGSGSGLDADLLDGYHAASFSLSSHNHDSVYIRQGGGTISNDSENAFTINRISDEWGAYIRYKNTVGVLGWLGFNSENQPVVRYSDWGTMGTLLHSQNYTSYTVTKTGSGASGTWGIDISGTATNATNLVNTPSLLTNGNTIAVKAGEKTSTYITVPYATSAGGVAWDNVTGKPETFPPQTHGHEYLYGTQVSSDQNNITWAQGIAKNSRRAFYYNTSGVEWSYLFGFSTSSTAAGEARYGAVLKMGYSDNYLRILRVNNGTWQSNDWEKISAGYADSVSWSGVSSKPETATRWPSWSEVTSKPSTFTPSSHTHDYLPLTGGVINGSSGARRFVFYHPTDNISDAAIRGAVGYMLGSYTNCVTSQDSGGINFLASDTASLSQFVFNALGPAKFFVSGLSVNAPVTATSFVKSGGTSSQFLKADGSVDSNSYWHSGNDGSGSGLDADTLDGYHIDNNTQYAYYYSSPASNDTNENWYLLLQTQGYISEDCVIHIHAGGDNRVSHLIIHCLCRTSAYWGWQTRYNECAATGIYKQTTAGEDIYLKIPKDTTTISSIKSTHPLTITKGSYSDKSYLEIYEGFFCNDIRGSINYATSSNYANSAGSVAWSNVSGKPDSYTPATHNHDETYLKLSGGTLTGTTTSLLTIKSSNSNNYITFRQGDTNKGYVGWISGTGTFLQNGTRYIHVSDVGDLKFYDSSSDRTIYHSGNLPAYPTLSSLGAAASNHNHDGTYLKLSGGTMTGPIQWSTSNGSGEGGWNIRTQGIQVLYASGWEGTGAPYSYATALHVSGTYWFQLCFERGGNNLHWRGGNDSTTWGWNKIWDANNFNPSNYSTTSHNHNSTYLKLSGGTLTGSLTGTTIYSSKCQSRAIYINHMTDNFSDSAERGAITYGTSLVDSYIATPASRGLGIYLTASSTADYSRIVLTALSGIYLDGTTYINGNTALHTGNHTSLSNSEIDSIMV